MRIRDRSRAGPLKFYDFVNFSGIKIPGLRKNQEIERTSLRFAAHLLVRLVFVRRGCVFPSVCAVTLYGGACKTFDGRRRAIAASSPVPLDAGQIGDGTAIVDFEREVVGELFGAQRRDGRFPRWSLHGSSDVTSQGYLEISDSCSASFHLLCRRFNYE